ncbi:MAG: fimbrial protein, partial [Mucinivorans sp.]
KLLKHISLVCLALLLFSCSKESIVGGDGSLPKGAAAIAIELPEVTTARGVETPGVGPENHIKDLKIFLFNASTKALEKRFDIDPSQSAVGNDSWDNTTKTLTITDLPNLANPRILYVVANWDIAPADMAKITDLDQLEAEFTELSGQLVTPTQAAPLLMSGKATHTFSSAKTLTVKVKRQAVKIELTVALDPKFTAAYPALVCGDIESQHAMVELRNAPNRSYVCEQTAPATPTGNKMLSYTPVAMTQTGATASTNRWTSTFYLYENPAQGSDAPMATYISLQMPYKDGTSTMVTKNYYRFNITTADATNPHATLRNKLYRLRATVLGFGTAVATPTNVEVTTEVLDWNGVPIDAGSMGDYFTVASAVDVKHNYTTTLPLKATDISKIAISTRSGKVTCELAPDGTSLLITSKEQTSVKPITDFDVITLTMGLQSQTITVRYLPHIVYRFAAGNLVNAKTGAPTDAWSAMIGEPTDRGLHFLFGSANGFKYGKAADEWSDYYTLMGLADKKRTDVPVLPVSKRELPLGWQHDSNVDADHANGFADICVYTLAGAYRTPKASEFVELIWGPTGNVEWVSGTPELKAIKNGSTIIGWAAGPNRDKVTYSGGKILHAVPQTDGAVFLPVTGAANGASAWEDGTGAYMSSSAHENGNIYRMYLLEAVQIGVFSSPDNSFGALRCIRPE